jgi:hypothetical protein
MPADLNGDSGMLPNSGTVATAEPEGATSVLDRSRSRLARFATGLYRQSLVEPIEQGRLRDLGWPYGLRSIVLAAYIVFVIAGLIVIFSGLIRENSVLIVFGSGLGLPEQMVWPLLVLLSFGVAALMAAAQHGPWWLRVLGLLFTLMVMGTWSLRNPSLAGWVGWPVLAAILMAAMLLLVIIRWRCRFAWWEFAVMWALVGLGMTIGLAETREAKIYGSDLNPLNLQQTAAVLGYLALPAATLAGASVAEVTVRATVAATQNAQRLANRNWPYLILVVVICIRLTQCVWLVHSEIQW